MLLSQWQAEVIKNGHNLSISVNDLLISIYALLITTNTYFDKLGLSGLFHLNIHGGRGGGTLTY